MRRSEEPPKNNTAALFRLAALSSAETVSESDNFFGNAFWHIANATINKIADAAKKSDAADRLPAKAIINAEENTQNMKVFANANPIRLRIDFL